MEQQLVKKLRSIADSMAWDDAPILSDRPHYGYDCVEALRQAADLIEQTEVVYEGDNDDN